MHRAQHVIAPRATTLLSDIEATLARHPDADLLETGRHLGMATRTLQRALAAARTSFQEVRGRVRLELACRLLLEPGSKVDCVARDVGFASTPHFVGWFRRHIGTTPSGYRGLARTATLADAEAPPHESLGSTRQVFETPRGLRLLGVNETRPQDSP